MKMTNLDDTNHITLTFKDEISLLFNPSLLSHIRDACTRYNQFVFGSNIM